MNFRPFPRLPNLMQRAHPHMEGLSVGASWVAALALLAWLASGWFWRLNAPEPVVLPTQQIIDPLAAARSVTQRHLFGNTNIAPGGTEDLATRRFTLLGAMTASRQQPGFAVLAETGKPTVSVLEGEEIAPGIKMEKVMPDKVSINFNGRSETLELVSEQSSHTPPLLPSTSSGAIRPMPPGPPNP